MAKKVEPLYRKLIFFFSKKMSLVQKLRLAGIVKTSEFILKSGQKSNIYFDFKGLLSHPKLVSDICYAMSTFLTSDNCYVAGVPMSGIPYASGISLHKDLPQLLIRESVKEYGMGNQIEGLLKNSLERPVILVEDVITTGGSVQKFIDIVEAHKLKVSAILCIMDRGTGVTLLRKNGYTVHSLFTMDDFLIEVPKPLLQFRNAVGYRLRIEALRKKSNLIVALDLTDARDIINISSIIAPHAVAIKLHLDTIDFTNISIYDFIHELLHARSSFRLLVIEDRKFADIPAISEKQLQRIDLDSMIDIVTVHGIIGPEQIKLLGKRIALLLVHQLSAKGNLIDRNYSNSVAQIGYDDGNVVGFVSQEYVRSPVKQKHPYRLPTFSPGANLDATTDGKGQQYTAKKEADYIIVGRGITDAKDPLAAVIRYKEHYWSELCDGNETPIQFGDSIPMPCASET
jgi:orotidine 5'-phosphate decarboxylase subfamily 1/orotate phosphoribosyltransferase